DDGQVDGQTRVRFPDGIESNAYDLIETRTPEGQSPAEPQRIDLGPGANTANVTAPGGQAGEPTAEPPTVRPAEPPATAEPPTEQPAIETPGDETVPGRLVVAIEDANGSPLPGGCVMLMEMAFQACDDDGNGTIVFDGLQPGPYTIQETVPPAGLAPLPAQQVNLRRNGTRVVLVHGAVPPPVEIPTTPEEPQAPPAVETQPPVIESGSLMILAEGPDGQPAPGGCYAAAPRRGDGPSVEACDDDDGADGATRLPDLAPGRYQVTETVTPVGFQPAGGQTTQVAAGAESTLTIAYEPAGPQLGHLVIDVTDPDGAPLGGSCFDLAGPADFTDICDQGDDGRLDMPDIPPGDYVVRQIAAAQDFAPAAEQHVAVPANDSVRVAVVNQPNAQPEPEPTETPTEAPSIEPTATPPPVVARPTQAPSTEAPQPAPGTGSAVIVATDEAGNPAGGGCYALLGPEIIEVCDNDASDRAPEDGRIRLDGLPPGQYDLFETRVPPGIAPAAAGVTADVAAGQTVRATFTPGAVPTVEIEQPVAQPTEAPSAPPATDTGNVVFSVIDPSGAPAAGACLRLDGPTPIDRVCDNDAGDAAVAVSIIAVGDLLPGDYTIEATAAPGFAAPAPQSFTVAAGARTNVVIQLAPAAPATGSLRLRAEDASGAPLPGACYAVDAGAGTSNPICDDGGTGEVLVPDVPTGDVQITQTQPPANAGAPEQATQSAVVNAGAETTVVFRQGAATGALAIVATGPDGEAAGGACFQINGPATGPACDDESGDSDATPGRLLLRDLPPGDYDVLVSRPGPGYAASDQHISVTVEAGQTATVAFTFQREAQPGAIRVTVTRGQGVGPGFCVEAIGGTIPNTPICDNAAGDADPNPDIVLIQNLPAATYDITLVNYPEGVALPDPQSVTVQEGQTADVAFALELEAPQTGTLTVRAVDASGNALPGACYELAPAAGGESIARCDDQNRGEVDFTDLEPGDYTIRQTMPPVGQPPAAAAQIVAVTAGEQATATFLPAAFGAVEITLRDDIGQPVAFCAELHGPVNQGPLCDNTADDTDPNVGTIRFAQVPAGAYQIVFSQIPGPLPTPEAQSVTVDGDQTAAVAVTVQRPAGELRLFVEDAAGNRLPNTCVTLTGPDGATTEPICDRGDDGQLNFPDLAPGTYRVAQTSVAPGFESAPEQTVEIRPGEPADLTIVLTRVATPVPTATATPQPTATATATVPPTPEATPTPPPAAPGVLVITAVGEDGNPIGLPGACYTLAGGPLLAPVCDNGVDDTDPAIGTVRIEGVPAGTYTVSQTRAPEGYLIAAPVKIAVVSQEEAAATVTNQPIPAPTGSLTIAVVGPGDTALGGACFRLTDADDAVAAEGCDNGPTDTNPAPGAIGFAGLPAGSYIVSQTGAQDGFQTAEPQAIDIRGDDESTLRVVNQPLEPETSSVTLVAQDEAGQPVTGQCFTLTSSDDRRGPYCDNGEGDANADPGAVVVEELPVGSWTAIAQPVPDQAFADRTTFTLRRGGPPLRVVVRLQTKRAKTGSLQIAKRDERNQPLGNACFALRDGNKTVAEVCDNGRGDGDGALGAIRFDNVPVGRYALTETKSPKGFEAAADRNVNIAGGQTRRVTVRNRPLPQKNGELIVHTVDRDGKAVSGACYALQQGARTVAEACDTDDSADDGATSFTKLAGGAYLVRQTRAPQGYSSGNDTAARVLPGERIEVNVVVTPRPGSAFIHKTDESGRALGGACFALLKVNGGTAYELCDNDRNDANTADGLILLQSVAPGDYILHETQAPDGYRPSADQPLTVAPGKRADVTVQNVALPPPPRRGDLIVTKTDPDGNLLPNACWSLLTGTDTVAGPICDSDDGRRDGVTRFTGVGIGTLVLRETRRPSAEYARAPDRNVTIEENRTTRVSVENQLLPGQVLVRKTDPNGQPLAGACYTLENAGRDPLCTDGSGAALFTDVPVGTYRLVETQTPQGFLPTAPLTEVRVNPAATTVLDVVNQPAPPPPDTGSLQVVKFICPAGDQGEFTSIFNSSNPGAGKLGLTAGCEPGDARFRLEDLNGAIQTFEFVTGSDGRFLVTLPAGTYRLTEISPDLPGDAVEEVAISSGQLTTIVVLNFVAPPPPTPGTLEILKFTCVPGLAGVVFADFINGCADSANLTNNVGFRVSGPVAARQVTGDAGEQGITHFYNLPPGRYTVREESAADTAQTITTFCGPDPNAPNVRGVGEATTIDVGSGQQLVCYYFNVPDVVTDTTGSIAIHKYACPVATYPAGFDWRTNCAPQGAGVRFALSVFDGERFAPRATGATDADGILRFVDAAPGVYQLTEIGAAWCRAESDSVDANGNIIVRAGERAEVWILNCVGTKNPPNTGAGPLAAGFGVGAEAVVPAAMPAAPRQPLPGRVGLRAA
ncbi:MAG: hypothetical protein IT337_06030, partial [Thermomicrobiales bacterium]|nr:hypothetical protein [Thermomicrobiales bacterium]